MTKEQYNKIKEYRNTMSWAQVAEKLNSEGERTPRGNKWGVVYLQVSFAKQSAPRAKAKTRKGKTKSVRPEGFNKDLNNILDPVAMLATYGLLGMLSNPVKFAEFVGKRTEVQK